MEKPVLILTNSLDATASELVKILSSEFHLEVLRWNIDLADMYEMSYREGLFTVVDPVGRQVVVGDEPITLIWRKPFLDQIQNIAKPDELRFVKNQFEAAMQALYKIAEDSGSTILIRPRSDQFAPKLFQLRLAENYFNVPDHEFSVIGNQKNWPQTVTKSLSDAIIGDGQLLFTTEVDPEQLVRPFPWFIQEALPNGTDVTVVYIDGKTYWYECGFKRSQQNIDWRTEINSPTASKWQRILNVELTDAWDSLIHNFMKALDLRYGRLDFILDNDGELHFLEVNPNGEFGWLDSPDLELHRAFAAACLST
jgi:hypothetical protein